jgi:hypothetical protein
MRRRWAIAGGVIVGIIVGGLGIYSPRRSVSQVFKWAYPYPAERFNPS